MDGEHLSMKKHLRSPIGAHCQVHEEDEPCNSQLPRTKGAICMAHSGNAQRGFKFTTLRSGKKVTHHSWDELPMTDTVIDRVNELGKDQPEILVFRDRKGRVIGDVETPGVDGDDTPQNDMEAQDELVQPELMDPEIDSDDPDYLEEPENYDDEVVDETTEPEDEPEVVEPADEPMDPEPSPGVRRSGRVRFQARESYAVSYTHLTLPTTPYV